MSAHQALGEVIHRYDISPLMLRFMSHVDVRADGCWHWIGAVNHLGYGECARGLYGTSKAHRASYVLFKGDIAVDMHILHSCDVRPCVSPDHLSAGTHSENMQDMTRKGRQRTVPQLGESNPQAKLTDDMVRDIRTRVSSGEMQRSVATDLGVSPMTVSRVVRRELWAHVG